jgi:hypothetical protein
LTDDIPTLSHSLEVHLPFPETLSPLLGLDHLLLAFILEKATYY